MISIKVFIQREKEYLESLKKRNEEELIEVFPKILLSCKNILQAKRDLEKINFVKNQLNNKIKNAKDDDEKKTLIAKAEIYKKQLKDFFLKYPGYNYTQNNYFHLMIWTNFVHPSVPIGKTSKENNIIQEPEKVTSNKNDHWKILQDLNWIDRKRTVKMSGSRFVTYQGFGAKLLRVLIKFCLDYHLENGYQELFLPHLLNTTTLRAAGQLPKFAEDLFAIPFDEKDSSPPPTEKKDLFLTPINTTDLFLTPTAEVPLMNYYQNTVFTEQQLPIKLCSYSLCFRKEAGAAGKDTRGLKRLHQFNKVEMVQLVKPENSYETLEEMLQQAQGILEKLKLPYRTVSLCSGDLGFSATKTYDLEVWMPGQKTYWEIASISNTETFQSDYLKIKYKDKFGKNNFVHALNGSGLALDRLIACLIETYYNPETKKCDFPDSLNKYL